MIESITIMIAPPRYGMNSSTNAPIAHSHGFGIPSSHNTVPITHAWQKLMIVIVTT